MKCPFQEGEFGANVKYGYINVGKVIEGSKAFKNKYVYTLFPHQTLYTMDESDLTIIPDSIPLKRCLLTANMETAINGMWDTLPTCGDKVLIIGAGIVGLLTAYLLKKIPGVEILLIDQDNKKSKTAKKFGIEFSQKISDSYKANIIYECSGNPSVINELSTKLMEETIICILSWYGNATSNVKFGTEFLSKRSKIIFSQVSKVSHNRSKYWNNNDRKKLALSLLDNDKLDLLIEKKMVNFYDLPIFFSEIKNNKNFYCKVVDYGVKKNVRS
jgi:threonine dehydrogenase-like Zn-dependent dehydrogenase